MNVIGWKIFYDDYSTYSSKDGPWEKAPTDGVLFVIEFFDNGTKDIHQGNDYYILEDDTIYATGDLGPLLRKWGKIKFGRWTNRKLLTMIQDIANKSEL